MFSLQRSTLCILLFPEDSSGSELFSTRLQERKSKILKYFSGISRNLVIRPRTFELLTVLLGESTNYLQIHQRLLLMALSRSKSVLNFGSSLNFASALNFRSTH